MREQDELTTVATFSTRAEADLAQDHLQGEGVNAFVFDEITAGVMPFLGGATSVAVKVPTEQLEKAREVLGLSEGEEGGAKET
jgi:hypothetical protein